MKTIRSPKVAEAPPQTWSSMKVVNGHFHIAGMTGSGPKGEHPGDDMYIQAKSIFQKFKDLLEAAGGKMNDIMSITVYVTNLDENTEVWRARRESIACPSTSCLARALACSPSSQMIEWRSLM